MDWITGMQRAIDYIETHLTEQIDYEQVAAACYSSSYHWGIAGGCKDRTIEIWIPVEKK